MIDTYKLGRFVSVFSDEELERRRDLARKYMADNDLDCIVLFGHEPKMSGVIRYFIDWPADFCHYGSFVFIPKDGDLALFAHGPFQNNAFPAGARGIELNFGAPYTPNWPAAQDFFTGGAVAWLKKHGIKKLGVYHKNIVPLYFMDYILNNIDGVSWKSVDEGLDLIRARKSDTELTLLRHAVKLHDIIYSAVPVYLRPGRLERDIAADLKKASWDLGGDQWEIQIGSEPKKAKARFFEMQNKAVQEGDTVDLAVRISGPGSYWGDLSRMWVVGAEPSKELEKGVADSIKIQEQLAKLAKPGAKPADLRGALQKFQKDHGYTEEGGFAGYGQGTDMVERPAFLPDETMVLEENMYLSIGPGLETDKIWARNADNYLVTKDGAVRLNETAQGIFRV
jgi:Xaa-Pro aminopeptidase